MSREQAESLLSELRSSSPAAASVALGAAAQAFKLRPQFLRKQPRTRQAEWMRRALSRHSSASVAEEVLATYFLESRDDLLIELLDALGVEHKEGQLTGGAPRASSSTAVDGRLPPNPRSGFLTHSAPRPTIATTTSSVHSLVVGLRAIRP